MEISKRIIKLFSTVTAFSECVDTIYSLSRFVMNCHFLFGSRTQCVLLVLKAFIAKSS